MINVIDGETHGQPYREVGLYCFDDIYIAVIIRYYPKSVYVAYEDLDNECGYSGMDMDDVAPSQVVLFKKYPRTRFNEQNALEELYRHFYPSLDIPKPLLAKIAADIIKVL